MLHRNKHTIVSYETLIQVIWKSTRRKSVQSVQVRALIIAYYKSLSIMKYSIYTQRYKIRLRLTMERLFIIGQ